MKPAYTNTELTGIALAVSTGTRILKKHPLPPGRHLFRGRAITFAYEKAEVVRDEGERGDGIVYSPADPLKLTAEDMLHYVDLARENPPTCAEEEAELLAEAVRRRLRGKEITPTKGMLLGLAIVQTEQPEGEEVETRTPAKRFGDRATVRVTLVKDSKRKLALVG